MGRRRGAAAMSALAVAALMIGAASAWACTNFIRIDALSPAVARPAEATVIRGVNAVAGSTVALRWNQVDGPVLAETIADATGAFTATVEVPKVAPGIYVITATSAGFVARTAVEVSVPALGSRSVATLAETSAPAGDPGAGMTILAGGLLLLASAAVVVSARRRPASAFGSSGARTLDGPAQRTNDLVEVGR